MPLHPTHRQIGSPRYRQPGGAWDVPTLDALGVDPHAGTQEIADTRQRFDRTDLARLVGAVAGGLRAAGVTRGDAVAWQLPNCTEAAILFSGLLAAWRRRRALPPPGGLSGRAHASRRHRPDNSVGPPGLPLFERAGVRRAAFGEADWETLVSAPAAPSSPARGSDLAVGLFTSGSTGEPKVVLQHRHRALAYKAITLVPPPTGSSAVRRRADPEPSSTHPRDS